MLRAEYSGMNPKGTTRTGPVSGCICSMTEEECPRYYIPVKVVTLLSVGSTHKEKKQTFPLLTVGTGCQTNPFNADGLERGVLSYQSATC